MRKFPTKDFGRILTRKGEAAGMSGEERRDLTRLRLLLETMLSLDPNRRPSAKVLRKHEFVRQGGRL